MHQAPSTPLHTHHLTNNTPKHRTNVATINKLATKTLFSRASHFTRATFHTYLRFKLVIYYVIMVRWFECSQIFSYLAGGWFFNIYSWFYTGFLFRPKFSLRQKSREILHLIGRKFESSKSRYVSEMN